MANQVELTYSLAIMVSNEKSDEARIQCFFLTFDENDTPNVEVDFQLASEPNWLTTGRIGEPGSPPPPPPPVARSTFGRTATAATVPTGPDPYLAVVIRVVEEDDSNPTERVADANNVARVLGGLAKGSSIATIRAAVGSIVPDTDDDLIGSIAFVIPRALTTETQSLPGFTLTGAGANYVFGPLTISCQDANRGAHLSRRALAVGDDDDAREFIAETQIADLALLTADSANHLLDELFSGTTGDDDERAIIDLVRALPTPTVVELSASHGKTAAAYDSEVDGGNWDELRAILAQSIRT